jgi:hypothetical protein
VFWAGSLTEIKKPRILDSEFLILNCLISPVNSMIVAGERNPQSAIRNQHLGGRVELKTKN